MMSRRMPLKWITQTEFDGACAQFKVSQQELWLFIREREYVLVKDAALGMELSKQIEEIPW